MKLIDYAVLQAAEAKPSIETWECNIDDWLAAGHPGEARVYTTRDGTVTLRPSRGCPRGEIRPCVEHYREAISAAVQFVSEQAARELDDEIRAMDAERRLYEPVTNRKKGNQA